MLQGPRSGLKRSVHGAAALRPMRACVNARCAEPQTQRNRGWEEGRQERVTDPVGGRVGLSVGQSEGGTKQREEGSVTRGSSQGSVRRARAATRQEITSTGSQCSSVRRAATQYLCEIRRNLTIWESRVHLQVLSCTVLSGPNLTTCWMNQSHSSFERFASANSPGRSPCFDRGQPAAPLHKQRSEWSKRFASLARARQQMACPDVCMFAFIPSSISIEGYRQQIACPDAVTQIA